MKIILEQYRELERRLGIVLPPDLLTILGHPGLEILADACFEIFWDQPLTLDRLSDFVFRHGRFGGSDRIILVAGEEDCPVGLDYRHSPDSPALVVWDGPILKSLPGSVADWLSNLGHDIVDSFDDAGFSCEAAREASLDLISCLLAFSNRDACQRSPKDDGFIAPSAGFGEETLVEKAVGEVISETTFEHWSLSFRAVPVVGLAHHQYPAVRQALQDGAPITLRLEKENDRDNNGIIAESEIPGLGLRQLGYVPKIANKGMAFEMERGFQPVGHLVAVEGKSMVVAFSHALPKEQTVGTVRVFPWSPK